VFLLGNSQSRSLFPAGRSEHPPIPSRSGKDKNWQKIELFALTYQDLKGSDLFVSLCYGAVAMRIKLG